MACLNSAIFKLLYLAWLVYSLRKLLAARLG